MSNVDWSLGWRIAEREGYLRVAEKAMEDILEGTEFDCTHSGPTYDDNLDVLKDFFMGDDND